MDQNSVIIVSVNDVCDDAVLRFIDKVFHDEQRIPAALIPIGAYEQRWWIARMGDAIAGTAAIWKTGNAWHWGRFAVDRTLRGRGIGKALATTSFTEAFRSGIDTLMIDARDTTVNIIEKFDGVETGEKIDFYGTPVTPMVLYKAAFFERMYGNEK